MTWRAVSLGLCAVSLLGVLGGCGGGSSSLANNNGSSGSGTPQTIQGVATPQSVSVVTANNAN